MFVFEVGGNAPPKLIINFPTKRHWRAASQLDIIEQGLRDLVNVIGALEVRSIAIPPLGAGLGGLDWGQVRPLIERALGHLADVEVLLFDPKGATAPERMRSETPSRR